MILYVFSEYNALQESRNHCCNFWRSRHNMRLQTQRYTGKCNCWWDRYKFLNKKRMNLLECYRVIHSVQKRKYGKSCYSFLGSDSCKDVDVTGTCRKDMYQGQNHMYSCAHPRFGEPLSICSLPSRLILAISSHGSRVNERVFKGQLNSFQVNRKPADFYSHTWF